MERLQGQCRPRKGELPNSFECFDGDFGYYLFCLNLHKKGSMCNHQSGQDWNDLEVAYASRIEPDGKGTFQDRSISILGVTASILTCEIPRFVLKLKI